MFASLDVKTHTYTVNNQHVKCSVTTLVNKCFPFNPIEVLEKHYDRWKTTFCKYSSIISESEDDTEGKHRILQLWEEKKVTASEKGIYVHAWIENYLNVKIKWVDPTIICPNQHSAEIMQLIDFVTRLSKNGLDKSPPLQPFAAEKIVWWKNGTSIDVAGTIDALFKSTNGFY